jgi:hypothetical protein
VRLLCDWLVENVERGAVSAVGPRAVLEIDNIRTGWETVEMNVVATSSPVLHVALGVVVLGTAGHILSRNLLDYSLRVQTSITPSMRWRGSIS